MRRVFLDTEFSGLRHDTTLISIALVTERSVNGYDYEANFYAELVDFNQNHIDPWLQKNVIDKLMLHDFDEFRDYQQFSANVRMKGTKMDVQAATYRWVKNLVDFDGGEKVEIWGDVLTYDWFLFLDLMTLSDNKPFPSDLIYYIPFDLATLFKMKGVDPDIDREKFAFGEVYDEMLQKKHNALWDARVLRDCYNKLIKMPSVL